MAHRPPLTIFICSHYAELPLIFTLVHLGAEHTARMTSLHPSQLGSWAEHRQSWNIAMRLVNCPFQCGYQVTLQPTAA